MAALDVPTVDPGAVFAQLYADLHGSILSHVRTIVGPDAAEDVAQKVWEQMHRKLPLYTGRPDFNGPALVRRAATNAAIDWKRRGLSVAAGGRVRFESLDAWDGQSTRAGKGVATTVGRLADALRDDASPESLVCGSDPSAAREWLAVVYLLLPKRDGRALWLREVEQRSYADAARHLNVTVLALKSLLYRARERQGRLAEREREARATGWGFVTRFWSFVDATDRRDPERCWRWLGAFHKTTGKPCFSVRPYRKSESTSVTPRRVASALTFGPLGPGVYLSPACGHDSCVNPHHQVRVLKTGVRTAGRFRPERIDPLLAPPPPSGAELKRRREALGLGQRELARRIGWHQPRISVAESGRGRIATDTVLALEEAIARLERAEGAAA
jgi:DNA-directed RNA polymerase specialized sigma24 family protein